ncbi:uncharacterized protein Nmag_3952 (plasmid) [Natrialba magadii ATCC 43099]|uniref:Uncharacterized protein n=1 Tax=Natrialba magadii (strain ATCC 43099 / DSM 3394 / CCM 3739 / CIP 104546 / IAM 13178 / JCM 8861 / NBRC 102185 / NCIMB 2190 / MS3) TaxID=547559 RepID=D3T1N3_NATMM|nr:uncharacterized protein Nmag_3952 [Natrialba magadii ATCC 43099]
MANRPGAKEYSESTPMTVEANRMGNPNNQHGNARTPT